MVLYALFCSNFLLSANSDISTFSIIALMISIFNIVDLLVSNANNNNNRNNINDNAVTCYNTSLATTLKPFGVARTSVYARFARYVGTA